MAGTCNSIVFEEKLSTMELWNNKVFKSEEFFLPKGKHKFYFEIERNQFSNDYILYIVNPAKIKVILNMHIWYQINSFEMRFEKENLKIDLERVFLLALLGRPRQITLKFRITEESKIPGNKTRK